MKAHTTTEVPQIAVESLRQKATDYPTIRVSIGPCALGVHSWNACEGSVSRDVLQVATKEFPLKKWLLAIEARHGLVNKLLSQLAVRTACDPIEFKFHWHLKTLHDRERFWTSLAADKWNQAHTKLLLALEDPESIPEYGFDAALIQSVFDVLPASAPPSLLFTETSYEGLLKTGKTLAGWVETVPRLTTTIVVTSKVWQAYLNRAPSSRTKAILREGAQLLTVTDSSEAATALAQIVGATIPLAEVLPEGIDSPLLAVVETLARVTSHCPLSEEENDLARSQAERTLFEFLERWPETSGRFAQNTQLDFQFGARAVEIDLFCHDAGIAIEIDGYFHFLSDAAYRRDRAKDWELQRRGYLVLRFLANDILPRLEEIRDRIFSALAAIPRSLTR